MRKTTPNCSLLLFLLVAVWSTSAFAAPKLETYLKEQKKLQDKHVERLEELAQWCDENGLSECAEITRAWGKPHEAPDKIYMSELPKDLRERIKRPKSAKVTKSKGHNDEDSDAIDSDDSEDEDDSAASSSKKSTKSKAKKGKSKKSKSKKSSKKDKDTVSYEPELGTEEGITLLQYLGDVQLDENDFHTLVERKIMTETGEVLDQEAYDKYLKRKMFGQDEKSDAEDAKLQQKGSFGFGLGAGQELQDPPADDDDDDDAKPAAKKPAGTAKPAAKPGKAAKADADDDDAGDDDSKGKAKADEEDEDAIPAEIKSDQFTAKQLRELKSKKIVKVDRKTKLVEVLDEDAFLKYVKTNKIDLSSGSSDDEDDDATAKKGSRSKRGSATSSRKSRTSGTSSRKSKASKSDDDEDSGSAFGADDDEDEPASGRKASRSKSRAKTSKARSSSRKSKAKDDDEAADADSEADSLFGDDDPEDTGKKSRGSKKSSTSGSKSKSKSRSRKAADEDESLNERSTGVLMASVPETTTQAEAVTLLQIDDPTLTPEMTAELEAKGIIKMNRGKIQVLNQEAFRTYLRRVAAEAEDGGPAQPIGAKQPVGRPGKAAAGDDEDLDAIPSEIKASLFTSKQLRELKNAKVIKVDRKTKLVEVLNEAVFLQYVKKNNIDLTSAGSDEDDDATAKKGSRSKRSSASSRRSRTSGASGRRSKASKADDDEDVGSAFGADDDEDEPASGRKASRSKSRSKAGSARSSRSSSRRSKAKDDDEAADADSEADSLFGDDDPEDTDRGKAKTKAPAKAKPEKDDTDADAEADELFGDDDPEDTGKKSKSGAKKDAEDSSSKAGSKSKSRSRKAADESDESLNERTTHTVLVSVPVSVKTVPATVAPTTAKTELTTFPVTVNPTTVKNAETSDAAGMTLLQVSGTVQLTSEMVAEMESKGVIKRDGNQIEVLDMAAFQKYMQKAAAELGGNGETGAESSPSEPPMSGHVELTKEQIDELVSRKIAILENGNHLKILNQEEFKKCLKRFAEEKQAKQKAAPSSGEDEDDEASSESGKSQDDIKAIRDKLPAEKQELFDEWLWRFWEIREKASVAYIKLARSTAKGGFSTLGFEYLMRALQEDPDNAGARKVLGYKKAKNQWLSPFEIAQGRKGLKYHEKFGWIPARHIKKYEEGQRFYQGKWISKEEDAKLHANIDSGWVIETPHYIVTTNHSIEAGVKIGEDLEMLYRVWKQLFLRFFASEKDVNDLLNGRPGLATPAGKHKVYFFRSRQNYMDYLRGRNPAIAISAGLYDSGTKTAYFFAGKDYDISTMFHEATHQLFTEIRKTNLAAGKEGNFWVIEGIATFMESLHDEGEFHVVGGYSSQRMIAARLRFNKEKFYIPLQQFSAMNADTFQRSPDIGKLYSQAAGLMHFFVFYKGGIYREALAQILVDTYTFKSSEGPAKFAAIIQNRTGVPFASLDAQYKEFISQNQDELSKWRVSE